MSIGQSLLNSAAYRLLRLLASTWKIEFRDLAGLTGPNGRAQPVIWLVWHNRLLPMPTLWHRKLQHRKGSILVSRSKDGELIAGILSRFGGTPVRGSSSRGGARALAELSRLLAQDFDAYLTPDGPRGPSYSMKPGAFWLSRSSGMPIAPATVEFSGAWRVKSWDRFFIPKPFARIVITLHEFYFVSADTPDEQIAGEQEKLRELMLRHTVER